MASETLERRVETLERRVDSLERPKVHRPGSVEGVRPWDKDGISRRTWYRREKSKREGGE